MQLPYAFTEQGVAMLSSVLKSPRAVQVNIAIMRAFVRLRQLLATHRDLAEKLAEMEKKPAPGPQRSPGATGNTTSNSKSCSRFSAS